METRHKAMALAAAVGVGWWVGSGRDLPLPDEVRDSPSAVMASVDGFAMPALPRLFPWQSDDGSGGGGKVRERSCSTKPVAGLSESQWGHALTITEVAVERDLPDRAVVVAIATALQESQLTNHGHLGAKNDHDSQGVFQQRPSAGWGTPAQVRDVEYAAGKFFDKLVTIKGWQNMRVTEAAQAVQISAYPEAYQKHAGRAEEIAAATLGCYH